MHTLPNEIILKILCHCKDYDLYNISLTCKHLKSFIDSDKLWDILLKRDYPCDYFKKYNRYYNLFIGYVFNKHFSSSTYRSIEENPKKYYKLSNDINSFKKQFYYNTISMIWRRMCLSENLDPPYKKIIKNCEPELLTYLIINEQGLIYICSDVLEDIKKKFPHIHQKITDNNNINTDANRIYILTLRTLCDKILKLLIGFGIDNNFDISTYQEIYNQLNKKGYCKENFNDWYMRLHIPLVLN